MQGVGFRPHVYRLATELGLTGYVLNDERGVLLEVEGAPAARRPVPAAPGGARRRRWRASSASCRSALAPAGERGFEIVESERAGEPDALVLARHCHLRAIASRSCSTRAIAAFGIRS